MGLKYKFGAILFLLIIWWLMSFSPELAIRKHIFFMLHPIDAFTVEIKDHHHVDSEYGHAYGVYGLVERSTRNDISLFYLKKSVIGWYVTSKGSGP